MLAEPDVPLTLYFPFPPPLPPLTLAVTDEFPAAPPPPAYPTDAPVILTDKPAPPADEVVNVAFADAADAPPPPAAPPPPPPSPSPFPPANP